MGLTHLDAGVIIGFLDAHDPHHKAARTTLAQALSDADHLAMAASALAECLVAPARRGEDAIQIVKDALNRLPVPVIDLSTEIATQAARLRSGHRSLRLPDALVIATAAVSSADRLVTTDRHWPTGKAMDLDFEMVRI